MFKTNIIANNCLWLKTQPHFTLPFTEKMFILISILASNKVTTFHNEAHTFLYKKS